MASKSQKIRKRTVSRRRRRQDAIEPFALRLTAFVEQGTFTHETVPFTASQAKRLLIEFITVEAVIPKGQRLIGSIFTTTGKVPIPQQLNLSQVAFSDLNTLFVTSQLVMVYVDPGAAISFEFKRSSASGTGHINVTFSGRFLRP